jgi:hypothetical protein
VSVPGGSHDAAVSVPGTIPTERGDKETMAKKAKGRKKAGKKK